MTAERAALLLMLLAPLWPLLAAGVLCFGRRPQSEEQAAKIDREHRWVAASAALLSFGSLLFAMLLGPLVVVGPDPGSYSQWLVVSAARSVGVHFQLRMDALSGPAAMLAAILSAVAVLAHRRDSDAPFESAPPYRLWMTLLFAVQFIVLANDFVLLVAALILAEMLCRALVPVKLSLARSLTTLAFVWIVLQWVVGFSESTIENVLRTDYWLLQLSVQQPIFTLVSGLCLLVFVVGRMGLYPLCVDVDRIYDESPGRLFWFGCLGSWIPAQYMMLRFWPVLGSSMLGVPSLASFAVLLTMLSAWLVVTRPHRAASLAMVGSGMLALTWTALGSGNPYGPMIAASGSLSLTLLFGSLVILCDASGWLDNDVSTRPSKGRRTLWITLILLCSGIGLQNAWEVTFDASQVSQSAERVDVEDAEIASPVLPAMLPMLMAFAHVVLWSSAAFVMFRVILGIRPRTVDEQPPVESTEVMSLGTDVVTDQQQPSVSFEQINEPSISPSWLTRGLCGGLVVLALLWGPGSAWLLQQQGQTEAAEWLRLLTTAPWGVLVPAGLLGLVVGCWIGFARTYRQILSSESWEKFADAGRRMFYLSETARYLTWPFRQILMLPILITETRTPVAELVDESPIAEMRRDPEPESTVAAWLLPAAGLASVAVIWSLLLLW